MMDSGVKVASQVYSAAQPALQSYAPKVEKRVTGGLRAVKGDYDNIRDRLVNEDQRAGNAIASVRIKIPDLGL